MKPHSFPCSNAVADSLVEELRDHHAQRMANGPHLVWLMPPMRNDRHGFWHSQTEEKDSQK